MLARISKARLVLQNPNGISVRREKTSSNSLPLTPNQKEPTTMQTTTAEKTKTIEPKFYKVQAFASQAVRVSRHGISKTKGGIVLGESLCWLDWKDSPIYIEEAGIKELYPDCETRRVWKMK